jgi:hypothetical protein
MQSVTFTTSVPVVTQRLNPPPGATALIIRAHVSLASLAARARLLHLRLADPERAFLPRATQIVELLAAPPNALTAAFSGFGGKRAKTRPVHMGSAGFEFDVVITVPLAAPGEATIAAGALSAHALPDLYREHPEVKQKAHTDLLAPLELIFGIEHAAELEPPIGSTITWEENVEWVGAAAGAGHPPVPAPPPTTPPPVVPQPPVPPTLGPLPTFPGEDPRLAAALALAQAAGFIHPTPEQLAAIQVLLSLRGK